MIWYTTLSKELRKKIDECDETQKGIAELCLEMQKALKYLERKVNLIINPDYYYTDNLKNDIEELYENFGYCRDLCTGQIKEDEWNDFSFDGDFTQLFNDYLEEFWDICDTKINKETKLCFVEF